MAKSPGDKRVYDVRASAGADAPACVLAISADATLLDLHLALLGASNWHGKSTACSGDSSGWRSRALAPPALPGG